MGCGKGRLVKIITDNSVESIVFGNTDIPHMAGSSSIAIKVLYEEDACGTGYERHPSGIDYVNLIGNDIRTIERNAYVIKRLY